MNFGKYAILDKITHYFKKEPDLYWTFRYATPTDELQMSKFYDIPRFVDDGNGGQRERGPHWIEIMVHELAILFDETNLPDGDGNPILPKRAPVHQIEKLLKEFPEQLVEELWIALGEAVEGWGPVKLPKDTEAGPTSSES